MRRWFPPRRLPEEHPQGPLRGFKLAFPVVSADGARAAFTGALLAGSLVYEAEADARCLWGGHHPSPRRGCGCGFYCYESAEHAYAQACDTRLQRAAVLEVTISGRYIRYEQGFRFAHQRVDAVRVAPCRCGRPADVVIEAGLGHPGWRRVLGACLACAGSRPALTLADYAARFDAPVRVVPDTRGLSSAIRRHHAPDAGATSATGVTGAAPPADGSEPPDLAILQAEVALLQARLDDVQSRIARLTS